jgi:hypothetical protein
MEIIIAQLDRISADSQYRIDDHHIHLTIDDFEGFDEEWEAIDREFVDEEAVEEVLDWLEECADRIEGDFYRQYHFGDIIVEVDYASYDI